MFNEKIRPTLTLIIICLVISSALAGTYAMTKPIIDANAKKIADESRKKVFPDSKSFKPGKIDMDRVTEYYVSEEKTGVVVTCLSKSFGGDISVMVGLDKEGKITGVTVTDHKDTPGLGTKAMTVEYLSQYKTKNGFGADYIKDDKNVDYIVGATISSNAVYQAVSLAEKAFKKGGGVDNE